MRILLAVSSMQSGGAERTAALLANHWVGQGHHVTIFTTFSRREECAYRLDKRVDLEHLASRVRGSSSPWAKMRRLWAFRQAVIEYDPDVILSLMTQVNVAVLAACWGLNRPVVVSERIFPPLHNVGWAWNFARRLLYPRAKWVVMQTEKGAQWARAACPGAQVCVIPNAVIFPLPRNEPVLDPAEMLPRHRRVLLAVGRLDPQKGFDRLLEAFALISADAPDWDLVILGEGEERRALEMKRASLGLDDRVILPGVAGNLADWYERADLFVLSSRYEGFPNVLLEAMSHGLPAVSFDCDTGPSSIIRHGMDGILVPPGAGESEFAEALETLINDEAMRRQFGDKACEVKMRFSVKQIMRMWEEVMMVGCVRNKQ